MIELPFLEVFKRCGDVVVRGRFNGGLGIAGLTVGLEDLKTLFQPEQFYML